jgi:hypothetical protein
MRFEMKVNIKKGTVSMEFVAGCASGSLVLMFLMLVLANLSNRKKDSARADKIMDIQIKQLKVLSERLEEERRLATYLRQIVNLIVKKT